MKEWTGLNFDRWPISAITLGAAAFCFFGYLDTGHSRNFYSLLRIAVFIVCALGAVSQAGRFWKSWGPAYAAIGILFNPFVQFYFARSTWRQIDLAVAVVLAVTAIGSMFWPRNYPAS